MINNKLLAIEGQDDIMVSHLVSFFYVEGEGEVHETSFQSFEVVNVEMVAPVKEMEKAQFPMAIWKDVRTAINSGHLRRLGKSIGFAYCSGKFTTIKL